MAKSKATVSQERFVRAWMENYKDGTAAVAEALGVTRQTVSDRASRFRKRGVPLPRAIGSGGKNADVDSLKAIVAEYANAD